MNQHSTITAEQTAADVIRHMMAEGRNRRTIGAALGLTNRQVSTRAKAMGLSFLGPNQAPFKYAMHKRAVLTLTSRGCTQLEIADILGLTEHIVRAVQKQYDAPPALGRTKVITEWTPALQVLWDSNLTLSEIADCLGVRLNALAAAAQRAGLPNRGWRSKSTPPKPAPRELTPLERMQQMARAESRAHRAYTEARA